MKTPHWLRLAKYYFDYCRLYVAQFGLPAAARTFLLTRRSQINNGTVISVPLARFAAPLKLRYGTSDIAAFEKIFVWGEYAIRHQGKAKTIIDCGANIGLSVIWFAARHPNARIVALEPDSENYALLLENTRHLENLVTLRAGVWGRTCALTLANPGAASDSYQYNESPSSSAEKIKAFDIETLRSNHQMETIDLLKMDIEGAEEFVFVDGCNKWLAVTSQLVIEIHNTRARRAIEKQLNYLPHRHSLSGENDVFDLRPMS